MSFLGLTDNDFDAYQSRKWQSHLFNRERLDVKQKLLQIAREVSPHIVGTDGQPLAVEASVEHPALWNHKRVEAQHIFFTRCEQARKELESLIDKGKSLSALIEDPSLLHKHVLLAVTVNDQQVEIGLRLHADARVDRQNLERKSLDFFQRERLLHLLRSLPDPFHVGVVDGEFSPACTLEDEHLVSLLQRFSVSSSYLVVGRQYPRHEPTLRSVAVVEVIRDALVKLLPIFHFVAWTRENDFLSVRDELKKAQVARRVHGVAEGDRVRIVKGILSGKAGVVQKVEQNGALRLRVGMMSVKVDGAEVAKVEA